MIMVQSTFQLLPDSREEALQLMKNMVRLCRQEYGCLTYEYFEGVTETNQVILLQEWKDADCLQEHYQTDHMEDFIGKLGNFLESPITTRSYVSQEDGHISTQASEETAKPEQTIH